MLVLTGGDETVGKAGIYIHIPFCRSKCPYCDFYSMKADNEMIQKYVSSLAEAVPRLSEKYGIDADTLYIGGGTPSLIGADNIMKIVSAAKVFGNFDEVTVECNPSCVETDFFEKISASGVNRISLGLQSAVDSERRSLGRLAGIAEAEKCIRSAKDAGIENISLDVMLGIPSQTQKSFEETLDFCVSSGVAHISAYMLKLEENTFFYKNQNKLNLPDDDFTADMYLEMVEYLEKHGFHQYEISNFALDGYESRHNLKYWKGDEYLGIGPAAHSFIRDRRFYYPRDIEYFMNGGEPLDDGEGGGIGEYVMLGLRLTEGISYEKIAAAVSAEKLEEIKTQANFFEKSGFVKENDLGFCLTPTGFLISNTIIEKILSVF